MGADRVAVIVCCGERPVTRDLLRHLSDALIAAHQHMVLDTHFGEGSRGKYEYWYHFDWLLPEEAPAGDAEPWPCPRCGGAGTVPPGLRCPVCDGGPPRADWGFGVGYPVEWVREAFAGGQIERRPNYVLGPDGRLYPWWWFERALSEYPGCWVVPMYGGP